MQNDELLPCPFCGGEAVRITSNDNGPVYCRKCGLRSLSPEHWNTRTAHSGEGRSNGAGEGLAGLEWTEDNLSLRTPYDGDVDGEGRHIVVGGDLIVTFDDSEIADKYRDRILAALSTPQGEVERGTLPRLDEGLIIAAMRGHYGSKADSIDGLDLTVDDVNWTFRDGFTRMWAGVRKELKRRAALKQQPD